MAMAPVLWMAFIAAVMFGTAFAIAIVLALTMAQEQADNRVRGRVIGGVQMLFRASLGLGVLGIGWLNPPAVVRDLAGECRAAGQGGHR
jgi:MFS family permease